MSSFKKLTSFIILLSFLSITLSEKISDNLLGGWGEKVITITNKDYKTVLELASNYFTENEGSLDENEIVPLGFFKRIVNESNKINYRFICGFKSKDSKSTTLYDIQFLKSDEDLQLLTTNSLSDSSITTVERSLTSLKNAIMKFYFGKDYKISDVEIQYQYDNIEGLNKYAVFDVTCNLSKKDEKLEKRVLVVYRNDRTFEVEAELNEQ